MGIGNPKATKDIHTQKKKQCKHKIKMAIKPQEMRTKEEEKKKKTNKNKSKILSKWQ